MTAGNCGPGDGYPDGHYKTALKKAGGKIYLREKNYALHSFSAVGYRLRNDDPYKLFTDRTIPFRRAVFHEMAVCGKSQPCDLRVLGKICSVREKVFNGNGNSGKQGSG